MRRLEEYELDFIRETAPDPNWSLDEIAEKLQRSVPTIRTHAKAMGIDIESKPTIKVPSVDWESIYYARQSGATYEKAAQEAGCSVPYAKRVVSKMIRMTEAERILIWNAYRKKHGMPLFTKC